jgi:RNA-directed DNA polymerase
MDCRKDLWHELCSYDNLLLAFKRARKHKTTKDYVIQFERNLQDNIILLRTELLFYCYKPKSLISFIIRDPKTRKISKSDFRDRVIHHALCNIIEPIFEKRFINDSYANRIGKGTLNAIKRFDYFKKIVSKNNTVSCYVLKADIRKYFENVDHEILIRIIEKRIKDKKVIWLIRKILANSPYETKSKGMPLGNLTSQFFANVYLD